ncbi:MAG: hypothetical protein ACQEW8_14645, partial [Actinomycetota bacterium]
VWKSVESDSSPVVAGSVLTYTLSFENTGEAPAPVDVIDALDHVTDDAVVSVEPVAGDGLSVSHVGDVIEIAGEVPVDTTATVVYSVTVLPDGERGDNLVANYLLEGDGQVPGEPVCQPEDTERPNCTVTPVSELVVSKSVDPESGETVVVGDELTYTLAFENVGAAPVAVDYTDHLARVLDDATLTGEIAVDEGLAVSDDEAGLLGITGTVAPGERLTITYTVTVSGYDELGDGVLDNFLTLSGVIPADECTSGTLLCTSNPVLAEEEPGPDPDPAPGPDPEPGTDPAPGVDPDAEPTPSDDGLAVTGGTIAGVSIAAALLALFLGGGFLLLGRRRVEEADAVT